MTKKLLTIAYIATFGLTIISLIKYRGVIANYLFLSLWQIILLLLITLLWLRITNKLNISNWKFISINNLILLPIVSSTTIICFLAEAYTFPNYIYATYSINHFAFLHMLNLSFFFMILTLPTRKLKQNWQLILFFTFFICCFFLYQHFPQTFNQLSLNASGEYDDNFMEWLQVFILSIGVVMIGRILKNRVKTITEKIFFCLIGVIFILLIGEEISWGQRLLSFNLSPSSANYQNELNLHNQSGLNELTAVMYYLVFIYAVVSWLLSNWIIQKRNLPKGIHRWIQIVSFKGREVVYLLPTYIFNPYADRTLIPGQPTILDLYYSWGITKDFNQMLSFLATWRETFEVAFYAALVLRCINIYREYTKH